jgi:DNA-binding response OmpR family regulator
MSIDLPSETATMLAMTRRVLLVDDDPHIRALLAFAFDKAGFTVEEAGDGEAALTAVARQAPHPTVARLRVRESGARRDRGG